MLEHAVPEMPLRPAYRRFVGPGARGRRVPALARMRAVDPLASRRRSRGGAGPRPALDGRCLGTATGSHGQPEAERDHVLPLRAGRTGLGTSRAGTLNRGLVGITRAVRWSAPVSGVRGRCRRRPFTRFM